MAVDELQDFKIVLNNPPSGSTYFPGTEVNGILVVRVDEPKNYRDIVICLTGTGRVTWSVTYGNGGIHTYTASKMYVKLQGAAWSENLAPDGMLSPGEHRYQFRFLLPPEIPSSFESRNGWIRYNLGARINGDYPNAPHTIETRLMVNEIVDLSVASRLPYRLESQKTAGCLCCRSGPVTTTVELPRTGYCVGEEIPFRVTVENGSSRAVQVAAVLEERIIYTDRNYHKYSSGPHVMQESEPVEPHRTSVWRPEAFTIPHSTPTSMQASLIQRIYSLKFTTLIPNVLSNPTLSVPLTIGNVPFNPDQLTVTPGTHPHKLQ